MPSPFLLFPNDRLSPAELSAACLDGHLVELGEGYLLADAVETCAMRAASLECIARPGLAAALLSAAWIHGAIDQPPTRHTLCRITGGHSGVSSNVRAVVVDLMLAASDVTRFADVAVTSPVRTLVDLARLPALRGTGQSLETDAAMHGLVERGIADPGAAASRLLDMRRLPPGGRTALARLGRFDPGIQVPPRRRSDGARADARSPTLAQADVTR